MKSLRLYLLSGILVSALSFAKAENAAAEKVSGEAAKPPNIIFILTDDQRYDALGVLNPQLNTPYMDRMVRGGVLFENAFVTTSLCSPSRASILTGQYMHDHGVVDNNKPIKQGTIFFPQYLQQAGYDTAFIGKWHMGGHHDDPQPGFDHWVSFAGQGNYYPLNSRGERHQLNVDGSHVPQTDYITKELTQYALDWLQREENEEKPFFLYLSHKAVHSPFEPAPEYSNQYSDMKIEMPGTYADTEENYTGKPVWVQNQRNSWHGVDFPYHSDLDITDYKRSYYRALSSVDDSVGEILSYLDRTGKLDNTIVFLMGDNGFLFGEHGLIDKRNAYEESMRVPLIMYGPGLVKSGEKVDKVVANIDIAPTMLSIAGIDRMPTQFSGRSIYGLARGIQEADWRESLLYEYYWEYNYPQTPTTFAVRDSRYKLIQYHGVYDTEELYDLESDPQEKTNLIGRREYLDLIISMREKLFRMLASEDGGHAIPYTEKTGSGAILRNMDGKPHGEFPESWMRQGTPPDARLVGRPDSREKYEEIDRAWESESEQQPLDR